MHNALRWTVAFLVMTPAMGVGPLDAAQLTGIHAAARAGDSAKVSALLTADPALVNATDTAGWTPLHFAAQQGRESVVKLLVARGANPYARLHQGGTPLHVAASTCRAPVVALLLKAGVNANVPDDGEWTPLHRAAIRGCREVAELLLARGANAYAWSTTSVTPIDQALDNKQTAFAHLLRARSPAVLPISDDFSGDCRWVGGENDGMEFGCHEGAYRVRLKRNGPFHIPQNFGLNTGEMSIEVNASIASGAGTEPGKALIGLACLSDQAHGYVGILRTDGAWAIRRLDENFTQLAGSSTAGAVAGLTRDNRLNVVCVRETETTTLVSFLVNGRSLGSVTAQGATGAFNGVALYADTFAGDVLFRRFVVRAPE